RERQAARYDELRSAALTWTRELSMLGSAASSATDARGLVSSLAAAESQVTSGEYVVAIETLERTVPELEALVERKRAELERAAREAEARTELGRAGQTRDAARALGERATKMPRFLEASAELDVASRAIERGDFSAAKSEAETAARAFAEIVADIERA